MSRRTAVPLHSKRHSVLVDFLDPSENNCDPHKGIATHLALGTGVRNDTVGHTHESWFDYMPDEETGELELYLIVPSKDECRKDTNSEDGICGQCKQSHGDLNKYTPKTPKSSGRKLQIPNRWYNHYTNQHEYFGLRDRVEDYFDLSADDAPDSARGVYDMIQAQGRDGVSVSTVGLWVRDVCAKAGINAHRRRSRLEDEVEPGNGETAADRIRDFGTDNEGNKIPDMIPHDFRASYCTQLCRTKPDEDNPDLIAIKGKTGHKRTSTLERYVNFAANEVSVRRDKGMY